MIGASQVKRRLTFGGKTAKPWREKESFKGFLLLGRVADKRLKELADIDDVANQDLNGKEEQPSSEALGDDRNAETGVAAAKDDPPGDRGQERQPGKVAQELDGERGVELLLFLLEDPRVVEPLEQLPVGSLRLRLVVGHRD